MRLFFAIDLPQEIKDELSLMPERYRHLAVRWTKPENLHLTLLFVGWKESGELPALVEAAKKVTAATRPFSLSLQNVVFGPPDRPPRMVWLSGTTPPEFAKLARGLSEATTIPLDHSPTLHLTLARSRGIIRAPHGQVLETLSLPAIQVKEFILMESKLTRSWAEYSTLHSFALGASSSGG